MKNKIELEEVSGIIRKAISGDIVNRENSAIIIYHLKMIDERILNLQTLFPKNTLHAIAFKANPLVKILERIKNLNVGSEAASLPELYMANKIGFSPENIVFDSPSKTYEELEYALKLGVYVNADSFDELDRIDQILRATNSKSKIGLRINPQVGTGKIRSTSVARKISKFGVPIQEHREEIINKYVQFDWLNGIHLHIGSQGVSIEQLIEGLGKVYELLVEINEQLSKEGRNLVFFDIGGGFPVSYQKNEILRSINEYGHSIRAKFPELFSSSIKLISEFGRHIYANAAFAMSRVEYVKEEKGYKILSIHLGADFLLRKAYNPDDWHHEISILDQYGHVKTDMDSIKYIVAGPLCFAGDIIAKDIILPKVVEGDYVVIHDVGAYTLSMWSRYNSRQIPLTLGYDGMDRQFEVLKKRETLDDLYDFWS